MVNGRWEGIGWAARGCSRLRRAARAGSHDGEPHAVSGAHRLPGRRPALRRAQGAGARAARGAGTRSARTTPHVPQERLHAGLAGSVVGGPGVRRRDLVAGGAARPLAGAGPRRGGLQRHPRREPRQLLAAPAAQPRDVMVHGPDRGELLHLADQAQHGPPHLHEHLGGGLGHRLDAVRPPRARPALAADPPLPAPLHVAPLRALRHQVAHGGRRTAICARDGSAMSR